MPDLVYRLLVGTAWSYDCTIQSLVLNALKTYMSIFNHGNNSLYLGLVKHEDWPIEMASP